MQPITHSNTSTLAAIAAAQAKQPIFAFDRNANTRCLARLQTIYAQKRAQLEAFYQLFDAGTPDFVLRNEHGHEIVLRLPLQARNDAYSTLRDGLDEGLRQLEAEIVQAHLRLEEEARYTPAAPDYVPAILGLCCPMAFGLNREQITQREAAAHARAEAEAALERPDDPSEQYAAARAIGAQYLWHVDFPAALPQQLACLDLFRLTAELPELLRELNGGQALDAHDYSYLSDVLRAALAKEQNAGHRLLQERTLAWVEATAQANSLSPVFLSIR